MVGLLCARCRSTKHCLITQATHGGSIVPFQHAYLRLGPSLRPCRHGRIIDGRTEVRHYLSCRVLLTWHGWPGLAQHGHGHCTIGLWAVGWAGSGTPRARASDFLIFPFFYILFRHLCTHRCTDESLFVDFFFKWQNRKKKFQKNYNNVKKIKKNKVHCNLQVH